MQYKNRVSCSPTDVAIASPRRLVRDVPFHLTIPAILPSPPPIFSSTPPSDRASSLPSFLSARQARAVARATVACAVIFKLNLISKCGCRAVFRGSVRTTQSRKTRALKRYRRNFGNRVSSFGFGCTRLGSFKAGTRFKRADLIARFERAGSTFSPQRLDGFSRRGFVRGVFSSHVATLANAQCLQRSPSLALRRRLPRVAVVRQSQTELTPFARFLTVRGALHLHADS